MKHLFFHGTCAVIGLIGMEPVFAQTDEDQSTIEGEDVIIVTATLRSENLQEVPIAVTAYTAETLEKSGVKDLRDLGSVSPSFSVNNSNSESGGTTIRIRGVGTTGNNTGLESAVGIFLDGVYLSRPAVALGDLLDVSQLELLRGPQGTLFGRNTSAGAISIRTAKPNLNEFEGYANATYGNYDLFNLQGGITAPVVEGTLGLRLSGAYRKRDGYVTSSALSGIQSNNRNRYLVRGQLLFEPNSDVSMRLIADYSKTNEKCCDPIIVQDTSIAALYPAVGLSAGGGVLASGASAVHSQTSNSEGQIDRFKQFGISGQFDWKIGNADLILISSYRESVARPVANSDYVNLSVLSTSDRGATATSNSQQIRSRIRAMSQEIRLSGSVWDDRLQYLIGAYYLDERIRETQSVTLGSDFQRYNSATLRAAGITAFGANPALVLAQNNPATGDFANNLFRQKAINFSLFTNNTLAITDRFKLNVGLRYSDDKKDGAFNQISARSTACNATRANATLGLLPLDGRNAVVGLACFPFAARVVNNGIGTPREFAQTFRDEELVYTGKLTWEPMDKTNSYISFTHGYKSGGFNLDPTAASQVSAALAPASPQFQSEEVDAYEFGIKTKLLDNRLTANLAIFKQDLSNFQVLEFTGIQFVTFNVPKAKSNGFELELNARVSSTFSANASLTYTDAFYPKDCAGNLPLTTGFASVRLLCGSSLTNSSKYVVVTGFDYNRDIGSNLSFGLNGSLRMESDRRTSTQRVVPVGAGLTSADPLSVPGGTYINPFDVQDGNIKINLRAGIGSQDGSWRIEIFGNNITNILTRSTTFNVPLRGLSAAGPAGLARAANYAEPRTYGLTLRTQF
ncbi:MAG: TonB-dependent receptor [Sphingorhabdus sp.]